MSERGLVFKITPVCFANIWGGRKLWSYGKSSSDDRIGESWELSFVEGSEAKINNAPLSELFPKSSWGKRARNFEFFPTLTKFIDAREKLSVQVHPNDDYALKNEGMYGKTEMWYVVEADEGAGLYMGFRNVLSEDEVRAGIADGSIEKKLSFVPVKSGDVFFIPAGTVHAIGGGVLIYEIQQNSTLTYRLYDYGRLGTDGKPRELHVEKALRVLKREPYSHTVSDAVCDGGRTIGSCEYFITKEYKIANEQRFTVTNESFLALTAVHGSGVLSYTDNSGEKRELSVAAGDSFFAPAADEEFSFYVSGELTLITVGV